MIEYNTLLEVPVEIREFYEEVVVSEPTGETVWEDYDYIDIDGTERVGQRLVPEYADVLYIKELPTPESKSKADLERVTALAKPSHVIDAFTAMYATGEQWEWFNKYKDYLVAVSDRLELIANYVPELDEEGEPIPLVEPDEPTAPIRPPVQDLEALKLERDTLAAISAFKASREAMIEAAIVTANGFQFDADEVSISRMSFYTLALINEVDTYVMQWSLADTETGVMTNITLGDLRLAQQLAVQNMASVWGL